MKGRPTSAKHLVYRTVFIYAFFSSLWILFSDWVLKVLTNTPTILSQIQTVKGWFFVLITTLLLYVLMRQNLQSLQESYNLLKIIIEGTTDSIFIKDLKGRYTLVNSAVTHELGKPQTEILGKTDLELFSADSAQILWETDQEIMRSGQTKTLEELVGINGVKQVYLSTKYVYRNLKDQVLGLIGISRNITERKQAEEILQDTTEKLEAVVSSSPLGILVIDLDGFIKLWNPAAEKIFGYTATEAIGQRPSLLVPGSICNQSNRIWEELNLEKMTAHCINDNLTKDGRLIRCRWYNTPLNNSDGSLAGVLTIVEDITEQEQAQAKIKHYAFYHTLTHLPNRTLFLEELKPYIQQISERQLFAILYIDINRFQMVKYSLGNAVANQLLLGVAERLKNCKKSLTNSQKPRILKIAHIATDEFVMLAEGFQEEWQVATLAESIQQQLAAPFYLEDCEVFIDCCIGLALGSSNSLDAEELLLAADTAMNQAKVLGKGRCVVFNTTMRSRAVQRLQLDGELRRALENREFRLHYQPILSLSTQEVVGFEALVRWLHPQRGLVPPNEFIPLAEETGLVVPLGAWVLYEVCQQMVIWQQIIPKGSPFSVNVNLSAIQLTKPGLLEEIDQILIETKIDPVRLNLEITETAVMENAEEVTHILQELKARGFHLSIDDFGTGYSSLSYLHSFPFDTLKIDRSFVGKMSVDVKSLEIIRTIILLAHNLGMNLVAEGIETVEQLQQLQSLQCEKGQGYLFSKPLDREAAEKWLSSQLMTS